MSVFIKHSWYMMSLSLRKLVRNPMVLAFTLVQPMVWLLLFGQLFQKVTDLPGFHTGSYLTYLTPGVIIMTAMFSAGWSGTELIQNMERGVMDRYLTSPVSRGALINGTLAYQALVTLVQSVIVLGVGVSAGARYDGGIAGLLIVLCCAVLLATCFAALSSALALLTRQHEVLIGVNQFLSFPLLFLSSVMMAPALMPGWVSIAARFNPVDWGAAASRSALSASPNWSAVTGDIALLLVVAIVMGWLATRAFKSYQRAV